MMLLTKLLAASFAVLEAEGLVVLNPPLAVFVALSCN